MKSNIEKRIQQIVECEEISDLKKCLCPFFEIGGFSDCKVCRKSERDLEECRDYYLDRIKILPQDFWTEEFDKFISKDREQVDVEEAIGIGMHCDSCYMSDKCPMFKVGYKCGIKWDTNKPKNATEMMDFLINTQYERVRRSAMFEKIDGGVPDGNLSSEMDRLSNLVAYKADMGREKLSINVEASGAAKTEEGGGILARIFGGAPKAVEAKKPIEIPVIPESREGIGEITDFEEIKEPEKVKEPRSRRRSR